VSFSAGDSASKIQSSGLQIQWQISTDGGASFSNLVENSAHVGTSSPTLQLIGVGADQNGILIRYIATYNFYNQTSNACTLTVSPAYLPMPAGIATDSQNKLFVSDASTNTVYQGVLFDPSADQSMPSVALSLLAGTSGQTGATDGTGSAARFNHPAGLAVNQSGLLAVADAANGTVRQVSAAGAVSTLAGSSSSHGSVDGVGSAARFSTLQGIALKSDGSYFVADSANHTIRQVMADGTVTTFAGSPGNAGWADGAGSAARFNDPEGIAVDASGTVYVADTMNNLIRKITPAGIVSTLAGLPGIAGAQDGAPTQATFNAPSGIAVAPDGDEIYVADTGNSTIRVLVKSRAYEVGVLAGTPGVSGLQDGYSELLDHPRAIAVDNANDYYRNTVYVADTGNAAIRKWDWNSGLKTIALGTGPVISSPVVTPPPATGSGGTASGSSGSSSSGTSGGGSMGGVFVALLGVLCLLRKRRLESESCSWA